MISATFAIMKYKITIHPYYVTDAIDGLITSVTKSPKNNIITIKITLMNHMNVITAVNVAHAIKL
jgi:hypothetical protein